MQLFLIFSCHEKKENLDCEEKIRSFNYPADIELLEKKNFVCNGSIFERLDVKGQKNDLKSFDGLKVLFSDKNYTLLEYDIRTRLLNDRKQNLWLVFKATEVNNFYFNKPGYKNIYGLFNIYLLDNNLMPLYSFNRSGIKKYRLNERKKITESVKISLNKKITHDIDLINYDGILSIVKELKSDQYKEKEIWKDEYYYKAPPVWSDL